MDLLDAVGLTNLLRVTRGRLETCIGLIDGHVDFADKTFENATIRDISNRGMPSQAGADIDYAHATFLASALVGTKEGSKIGMCRDCTLMVWPIFTRPSAAGFPISDAMTLASAIVDTVEAGAGVINLSLSVAHLGKQASMALTDALDFACSRGAIIIAASGNEGELSSSPLTSHAWVIPVVAYHDQTTVMPYSNTARSIGNNGLGAPGNPCFDGAPQDAPMPISGTSVAAIFVTAAAALLTSEFPQISAGRIVQALRQGAGRRRRIFPPLLDAWTSYMQLSVERNKSS